MKAQTELNALLLQAKNYERLKQISIYEEGGGQIVVEHVPAAFIDLFVKEISKLIKVEINTAAVFLEEAAQSYAKAAAE